MVVLLVVAVAALGAAAVVARVQEVEAGVGLGVVVAAGHSQGNRRQDSQGESDLNQTRHECYNRWLLLF